MKLTWFLFCTQLYYKKGYSWYIISQIPSQKSKTLEMMGIQYEKKWHQFEIKKWVPNKHSLLCSKHFDESCFIVRPGKQGHRLKDGAVPTNFVCGKSYYDKPKTKRKAPLKRQHAECTVQPAVEVHLSPSKYARIVTSDHSYTNTKDNK